MRRFAMNRWWAFMLAVGLLLTSSAVLSDAYADVRRLEWRSALGVNSQMGDPDDPIGGGIAPPGSKKGPYWSATPTDSWTEGDGSTISGLQGWWYHVIVFGLRGGLYRF